MLRQQRFDPAIRAAVGLAKSTLNKYYECTDFSKLYWISMGKWYFVVLLCYATDCWLVLHPHHKLEYFRHVLGGQMDWWCSPTCSQHLWLILCFLSHSQLQGTYFWDWCLWRWGMSGCFAVLSPSSCHQGGSNNIFDNLPSLSKVKSTDECNELDMYLTIGVEDIASGGALKWWHNHCSTYPCLLHIVLDYLTIPGKHLNPGSDWPCTNIHCSYFCWCRVSL